MFGAGSTVFAVWGYVIANTVDARVELNPQLLAAVLGDTPENITAAIDSLCQPDPASRNPAVEGRRLTREGQYQYRVTSHEIYRALKNEEDRRAYNREKQRQSRARRRQGVKRNRQSMSALSAHTEAEAEAEATRSGLLIDPDHSLQQGNQQQGESKTIPPPTTPDGNSNGQKRKPRISGRALTVHDWMHDECAKTLGAYAEDFGLDDWFWKLDELAWREGLVIPKRDGGAWLQAELVAEAQRRGLPLRFATVPKESAWESEVRKRRRAGL